MGSLGLAFLVGLLLWFSQDCLEAATRGATVFAAGVMPALFPAMVLAGLPFSGKRSGKKEKAGRATLTALVFGMAAGSPAGARKVQALHGSGQVDGETAARLYVATGMVSPLFFLGSLALWTGGHTAALGMLAVHWVSALLTGALCWRLGKGRAFCSPKTVSPKIVIPSQKPAAPQNPPMAPKPSLAAALPEAIASAGRALLSVCGAMMLFSIGAALLGKLFGALFPGFTAAHPGALAILHGLLEIGGGGNAVCNAFAGQGGQLYALLSGLCGFGGLSIWIQNLAFAKDSIRPGTLLLYRCVHGAAAYLLARLLFLLWPQAAAAGAFSTALFGGGALYPPAYPLSMLLILGVFEAYLQKSKTCSPHN